VKKIFNCLKNNCNKTIFICLTFSIAIVLYFCGLDKLLIILSFPFDIAVDIYLTDRQERRRIKREQKICFCVLQFI